MQCENAALSSQPLQRRPSHNRQTHRVKHHDTVDSSTKNARKVQIVQAATISKVKFDARRRTSRTSRRRPSWQRDVGVFCLHGRGTNWVEKTNAGVSGPTTNAASLSNVQRGLRTSGSSVDTKSARAQLLMPAISSIVVPCSVKVAFCKMPAVVPSDSPASGGKLLNANASVKPPTCAK